MTTTAHTGFTLARKDWDSDFFGREIYSLTVSRPIDGQDLMGSLATSDRSGIWAIECHVDFQDLRNAPTLENSGFRLVDSRARFITSMRRQELIRPQWPFGVVRAATAEDVDAIHELTVANLVDDPTFVSRYNDRRLFTREESIRYYRAWTENVIGETPDLCSVWEVEGAIVAYFEFLRDTEHSEIPRFKGVLTAVDPDFRGHGAQNFLQEATFPRFDCDTWEVVSTTQLSNTRVIQNHVKAGKRFSDAAATFFRLHPAQYLT